MLVLVLDPQGIALPVLKVILEAGDLLEQAGGVGVRLGELLVPGAELLAQRLVLVLLARPLVPPLAAAVVPPAVVLLELLDLAAEQVVLLLEAADLAVTVRQVRARLLELHLQAIPLARERVVGLLQAVVLLPGRAVVVPAAVAMAVSVVAPAPLDEELLPQPAGLDDDFARHAAVGRPAVDFVAFGQSTAARYPRFTVKWPATQPLSKEKPRCL